LCGATADPGGPDGEGQARGQARKARGERPDRALTKNLLTLLRPY